ncbi:MAG: lysylphosphatidylglycerol synthase domain-containing protein [Actinomycetota bacterium]|nr:lysylphosphatidylglycerol synthase domain-containing protein [Actinomycetota bacterium]
MAGLIVVPPGRTGLPPGPKMPAEGAAPAGVVVADWGRRSRRPVRRWAVRVGAATVLVAVVARSAPSQVSTAARTLQVLSAPRWGWVVAAVAASALTHLMGAVAISGATQVDLRLGRTFGVQFASSFCNRLAPVGLGGMAANARYLERCGADRPAAVGAVGLNAAAGFVVHTACIVAVVPITAPGLLAGVALPVTGLVAGAAVGAVGVVAAGAWIRSAKGRLAGMCRATARDLAGTLRCRRRAAALFGGSAGITAAYGVALAASLWAFGVHIGLLPAITVLLVASAVAALSPTPGGVGVVEPALIAGLSGITGQVAPVVAGVLAYRFITYWLPVVPGAGLLILLRRRNLL